MFIAVFQLCSLQKILSWACLHVHMPASLTSLQRWVRGIKSRMDKIVFLKSGCFWVRCLNWKSNFLSQTIRFYIIEREREGGCKKRWRKKSLRVKSFGKKNKPREWKIKFLHYKTFHFMRLLKADIAWVGEKLFFLPEARARMKIRIQKSAALFLAWRNERMKIPSNENNFRDFTGWCGMEKSTWDSARLFCLCYISICA